MYFAERGERIKAENEPIFPVHHVRVQQWLKRKWKDQQQFTGKSVQHTFKVNGAIICWAARQQKLGERRRLHHILGWPIPDVNGKKPQNNAKDDRNEIALRLNFRHRIRKQQQQLLHQTRNFNNVDNYLWPQTSTASPPLKPYQQIFCSLFGL